MTAWDRTLNVSKRPKWLREATTIKSSASADPGTPGDDGALDLDVVDETWRRIAVDVGEIKADVDDGRAALMTMLDTTQDMHLFDASLPAENVAQLAEAQYQQVRV